MRKTGPVRKPRLNLCIGVPAFPSPIKPLDRVSSNTMHESDMAQGTKPPRMARITLIREEIRQPHSIRAIGDPWSDFFALCQRAGRRNHG
jgi:hypothetical protein